MRSRIAVLVALGVLALVAFAGQSPAATSGGEDTGWLSLTSDPVSKVYVDGREIGATPQRVQVPAGRHEVMFSHPDHGRKTMTATVEAGKTVTVSVRFP